MHESREVAFNVGFFASGCCCSRIWLRFKGISFFCFVFTKKYDYEEKEEVVGAKEEEVVIKGIIFLLPRMTSLSKFKLFIRDEMTLEKNKLLRITLMIIVKFIIIKENNKI